MTEPTAPHHVPTPPTWVPPSPTYPADARDAGLADRATQVAKGAATVVSAAVIALAVAAMCGIALLFLALAFAPDPL